MSDPLRTDPSRALHGPLDADRNAKVEQLLLDGLDCYFDGRYDQAIDVWTRVQFLDRHHARARAYIERARRALAERQRESEELLQQGLDALGRGDSGEARRLVNDAVGRGAPQEEALAILGRVDRVGHRVSPPAPASAPIEPPRRVRPPRLELAHAASGARSAAAIALLLAAAGGWVLLSAPADLLSRLPLMTEPLPPAQTPPPVPFAPALPLRGETALVRARALAAGGRFHDAIRVLEDVRVTDPQKADADRLRADLQRELIAVALAVDASVIERDPAREGAGR
jgi:hypothetical protein